MSFAKKIIFILLILALSPPSLIIGYNIWIDENLVPVLTKYTNTVLPEDVPDNAALDLAIIMRPEDVTREQALQRVHSARQNYRFFTPSLNRPLYPEVIPANEDVVVDVPIFKGLPEMFFCWLTLSGTYQMCAKDFALDQIVIRNGLYMSRYEELFDKENFAGDAVVNLPSSIFPMALLYMAQTSLMFNEGEQEEAVERWVRHHKALQNFRAGSHHVMAMEHIITLNRASLTLLERMLYLGMDLKYYEQVQEALLHRDDDIVNIDGILRADIGFNSRQLKQYFRPTGQALATNFHRWLIPGAYKRHLNHYVAPVVQRYHTYLTQPPELISDEITRFQEQTLSELENMPLTPSVLKNERAIQAARSLASYLIKGAHIIPGFYAVEAREKSLLLAMRARVEKINPDKMAEWASRQDDLYNPITRQPFVYDAAYNGFTFDDPKDEQVVTFIPFVKNTETISRNSPE